MPDLVSLSAVVDEMAGAIEGMHAFVNRLTGELYGTTDDLIEQADWDEEDDEEEAVKDEGTVDWEAQEIHRLRDILGSADWLEVPRVESSEDYQIMEAFCFKQCEGDMQEELLSAIEGRRPFRRFKDLVHRRGIHEKWYAFRRESLTEQAKEWLEANHVAFGP